MKVILGIDNGTQSTKTMFYDADTKKVLAMASAKHDMIAEDDGSREQKAEWWINALLECLNQVNPEIRSAVQAVGVSGQQHGFVAIDEEGNPLYKVKLWCDTSTAGECDEMTQAYGGEDKLLSEVGNLIAPGYTASKILWLKKTYGDLYEKMRWVLLPHDYLNFWLTGEAVMEYGDASGTGLLNVRERVWQENLIRSMDPGLLDKLPRLIGPDETAGRITAEAAAKTGLPVGIPVSSGGGDNMMGALGTGTVSDGVITMSMGTSGTLYGYSDKPIIDPEGILAAFCSSSGGWLPLLCTMNCTVATELTRDLFGLDVKEIDAAGARAPAGAEGVSMLPFFNGERVPNLPNGKASIMGLNATNYTKENIARASLESAVYGMKIGLDRFRELGFDVREIRMIGGGAKSPVWRQMAADVLGVPVLIPEQAEAAALGAALQAYWMLEGGGAGRLQGIINEHVSVDESESCVPDLELRAAYDEGYARYRSWLDALSPLYS
ncbi:MAG: xylulokinase [Spirochaetes bacterium]|nr:MAG: xylulokinase [Spirochaetota bacterium]